MSTRLLKVEIKYEHDVVLARHRARHCATLLGFEQQDQVRIATAVSELARNAFQYAGGGAVEFLVSKSSPHTFIIHVSDHGPGIADLRAVLYGGYVSKTGMGVGLAGAKRLMEHFEIVSDAENGTVVTIGKPLPAKTQITPETINRISTALAQTSPQDPFAELQRQNQELLATLEELRVQGIALAQLNRELEETNRGVVALYAELDERADYLKRASELKTQFLSNMTHEFRTPLNSILSISRLLLDRMDGELNPEQERQVNFIRTGAQDLSDLVNDLLDLAKVEAGKVRVRATAFEVADMFGTLRGMLKPLLEHNGSIALVFEAPENLPPLVTDEGKVSQILRNFISNGLKYTQRGEVRISADRQNGYVVFSVADTGIGIAPEDQQRIFEEFSQVEGPHQQHVKGTGLGLPLSRKLAHLLGGHVTVKSEPGIGSVFSLIIPSSYAGPEDAVLSQDISPNSLTTLIIDDSEADRYVLRRMMETFATSITEAANGVEGLRIARQSRPVAVILDLNMPDMTGFQVLEQLRADPQLHGLPVLIHTSKPLTEQERRQLVHFDAEFMSKEHADYDASLAYLRTWWETHTLQSMNEVLRHAES